MDAVDFRNLILEMGRKYKYSFNKIIEPALRSAGLTKIQAMILFGIYNCEIDNVSSVSRLYEMGQANTSTICKKMEKNGLITRKRDTEDERVVSLSITDKGMEAIREVEDFITQYVAFFKTIPPERLDIIARGFKEFDILLEELTKYKNF